jgi:hypothetical protein
MLSCNKNGDRKLTEKTSTLIAKASPSNDKDPLTKAPTISATRKRKKAKDVKINMPWFVRDLDFTGAISGDGGTGSVFG